MITTDTIKNRLTELRFTSHQGNVINLHHSLYNVRFTLGILLSIILIPILFNVLLIYVTDDVMLLWKSMFEFFMEALDLDLEGEVLQKHVEIFSYHATIPYPSVEISLPTMTDLTLGIGIIILSSVIASRLPHDFIPIAYIVYLCDFILFTSVVYFTFAKSFSFDLGEAIVGHLNICLQFLLVAPWILAFTFNIFHFSLFRKLLLPAVVIGYFFILYPFQFMLFAILLNKFSLLYLPLLHFILTIFIDMMIFIALYSWGMSWQDRTIADVLNHKKTSSDMKKAMS